MQKLSSLILMLCLILSGALCYAHGKVGKEQEKGKGKDGIPNYSCYIQWHEFESDNPGLYFKIHAAHVTYANVIWLVHPHHND